MGSNSNLIEVNLDNNLMNSDEKDDRPPPLEKDPALHETNTPPKIQVLDTDSGMLGPVVLAVITPRGSMVSRDSIKEKLKGKRLIPQSVQGLDPPQEYDSKGSPTLSSINGDSPEGSPALGSSRLNEDDVKMNVGRTSNEPTGSEPSSPSRFEGEDRNFLLPQSSFQQPLPQSRKNSRCSDSNSNNSNNSFLRIDNNTSRPSIINRPSRGVSFLANDEQIIKEEKENKNVNDEEQQRGQNGNDGDSDGDVPLKYAEVTFEDVTLEVKQLVANDWVRFKKSKHYSKLVQDVESRRKLGKVFSQGLTVDHSETHRSVLRSSNADVELANSSLYPSNSIRPPSIYEGSPDRISSSIPESPVDISLE